MSVKLLVGSSDGVKFGLAFKLPTRRIFKIPIDSWRG